MKTPIEDLVKFEIERIRAKDWVDVTQEEKNSLLRLVWIGRQIEKDTLYDDDPYKRLKAMALRQEDIDLIERLDPQGTSWVEH